ncbi:MAG: hypothetical protein JST04_05255 [Bdellovibrionales bacterium]|nr:hypothetical protein [Bdellovibrionales bacterium]
MFHSKRSLRPFVFVLVSVLVHSVSARAEVAGKPFNPDLSVNFLGLLRDSTNASENRSTAPYNGLSLQEAEIQFYSNVDAYLKAVALFSVAEDSGTWGIDPEEVYVETTSIPFVTFRGGKYKLALGKHNQLHTHAFPFIDAPLFQTKILGEEGLNATALGASLLVPLPWFSELTVQGFSLANEDLYNDPVASTSPPTGKTGFLARYRNLFEFGDDATLELGASASTGKNAFGLSTKLAGGDVTLKWRPAEGGKYHALIWNTEYLRAIRAGRTDPGGSGVNDEKIGGLASYVQLQFAERWWIQARAEILGAPHNEVEPVHTKQSGLLGFFPSEFSGFRLQYDHEVDHARPKPDHAVTLQYNVTIGAHPAHAY